ncbi:G-D-S-L family lipolytic protein [Hymenobacter amundsenii]|uniref:G-D-S-L family lipolytic protein n=1 Tax=Hymenobacter amundsenii TaxID=2006685 RepID=A0A246FPU7_9BACT|nr:SGNH/GDSL hydrolase family protein [Hymenobacter amundsenii]OWP64752.1 G-D-S-L family lipolytic protein [Hymenobacter amundsenii]
MNTSNLFRKAAPLAVLAGLGLTACQPDLEKDFSPSNGSADFSNYIAVGNSLTAGYSDGGLYLEGQQQSYPALLAQQFKNVGGGEFVQPLFTAGQENGSGYLRLAGFTAAGNPITANVTTNLAVRGGTAAKPLYTKFVGSVNNLGVPGIRLSDVETAGYGSVQGNPFFERITPDAQATQTYLARVAASSPTFFTNWLGNNDVLGYATAGGGASFLTTTADFTAKNAKIVDALTANGAKGVVATIPDVTNIPFFTTIGPSFRATLAAANVPSAAPFVYTTGTLAPGQPNVRTTSTLAAIRDASGTGALLLTLTASPYLALYGQPSGKYWRDFYAQARPTLPATVPNLSVFLAAMQIDTTKAFGQSTGNPFPSILVLDAAEQTLVRNATNNFNIAIKAKATEKGLGVFDANTFFAQVATNGIVTNGVNNTAGYISGNLFSLDGVHPTPRGYAIIANEFIKVINNTYGAKVPTVNANDYRGVKFP